MIPEVVIHFTDEHGHEATATGDERCISAIELALTVAGWLYHEESGSWDEGFYTSGHTE